MNSHKDKDDAMPVIVVPNRSIVEQSDSRYIAHSALLPDRFNSGSGPVEGSILGEEMNSTSEPVNVNS